VRIATWNVWWNYVEADVNECKIKKWKERSRNRADWEKAIKEAKVRSSNEMGWAYGAYGGG
jgi:hypothetical protein